MLYNEIKIKNQTKKNYISIEYSECGKYCNKISILISSFFKKVIFQY